MRQVASYEGQAAIEFENLCDPDEASAYHFEVDEERILVAPLLEQVYHDWRENTAKSLISARFHNGLANILLEICLKLQSETSLDTVAFSGGVWQNITLLHKTLTRMNQSGFKTLIHRQVPTNDGGICLGQVMIAAFARKN